MLSMQSSLINYCLFIKSAIVCAPISRRPSFTIGSSHEIMAEYSATVAAVLVKKQDSDDVATPTTVADCVKLPKDTSSCFILYPELPQQPGQVLGCEVSTFEVDDAGRETHMVLQTIADREFTNVCKLIPGYSKTLKIFTASVPCTPKDSGFDVELDSLVTRIYCRSRCIKSKELWSPGVDYVPGKTNWNGGPCQMVCRKGDYELVQMVYYDYISEIDAGVYLFELTDKHAGVDIIWNTLPVEKKIGDHGWNIAHLHNLVIQPVSFVIVPNYCWSDIFPVMRLVDEEHFKLKDKRAMSLAMYYMNDAVDARNKLIQARIQNDQLRKVNELSIEEYKAISNTANCTVERLYRMFTNLNDRHKSETDGPSRKRSRENSDDEADDDDQGGRLEIVEINEDTRQPESLSTVDGEERSFPSELFFKPTSKVVRFADDV